mgnify:CR=1 FL=1
MSDNISSASRTISTELTENDLMKCMSFNFKILLYICLIIIIFSLLISCLNSITMPISNFDDNITYESPSMRGIICKCVNGKCKCGKYRNLNSYQENFDNQNDQENFSNDDLYSYKKQQFAKKPAAIKAPAKPKTPRKPKTTSK